MAGAFCSARLREHTPWSLTGAASAAPDRFKGTTMLYRSNTGVAFARCLALSVAALGLLAASAPVCRAADTDASAASEAMPAGASVDTESGTISLIDQKNALIVVTVPGRDDLSFSVKDHPDVLKVVKVGDKLTTHFMEPYVTGLTPAGGAAVTRLTHTAKITQHSSGADNENFQVLRVFSGVAQVTGVDRKLNLLTVVDKSGTARSVRVSRPDLIEVMQTLKHHSHVKITYESEMTVIVAR
ncbi:hypothetical protein [Paraburkholderia heleia]|uniref:Uncharacterized protein n=2 Tax=Paraburkholderia silvatlantica TaxID=321895 RepID=A0A2V4TB01_9BURK|nr:hypothetical protein [Paraburkholderia heleia]PYE20436.1 hypothetical protein C7410_117126 [Paraburkholderia silvatlantica]